MRLRTALDMLTVAFPGMVMGAWEGYDAESITLMSITVSDGRSRTVITNANLSMVAKLLA